MMGKRKRGNKRKEQIKDINTFFFGTAAQSSKDKWEDKQEDN